MTTHAGDGDDEQRAGTGWWCGTPPWPGRAPHTHHAAGCSSRGRSRRSSGRRMGRAVASCRLRPAGGAARRRATRATRASTMMMPAQVAAETPESSAAALLAGFGRLGARRPRRSARRRRRGGDRHRGVGGLRGGRDLLDLRAAAGGGVAVDRAGQALVHAHRGDGREDLGAGGRGVDDGAGGLRRRGSGTAVGVRRAAGVDDHADALGAGLGGGAAAEGGERRAWPGGRGGASRR